MPKRKKIKLEALSIKSDVDQQDYNKLGMDHISYLLT